MIHFYHNQDGKLARYDSAPEALAALAQVVWIDMVYPTPEEEAVLEQALAIQIPTRADMEEIEMSSRQYDEAGALFLTANLMSLPNGRDPITAPVTFVLTEGRLVTVRYHAPRPFQTFVELSLKQQMGCSTGHAVRPPGHRNVACAVSATSACQSKCFCQSSVPVPASYALT